MKKQLYIGSLIVLSSTFATNLHAKIWRVNNGTGVVADFTTAQAAHNAAAAGDTIHLEPSLNDYGSLNMTKRLTVISTGSFSTSNPNLQADPKHGLLSNITINNTGANGSVLSVKFFNGFNINNGVSNISLINCVSNAPDDNANCCSRAYVEINNADNIIISKSFVSSIRFSNNSNNVVVNNSIVWGVITNDGTSDGVLTNNVFRAGNPNDAAAIFNCVVANNIWNKNFATSFTNCNVGNNFAPGTGTAPSGVSFVDMSTVFVDANGGFVDNVYQLKVGSPAIAAGEGGIDCGAFGGGSPYKLGATPAIPSIYKLNVPAAPAGNSMNIIFSTRSNN